MYEEHAEALAAPIAEQFGIRIYDVEYVKEGDEYFLNVYIDKDGGVNINDCENVSRLLSDALDKDDPNPDAYTLIVSSPGLGMWSSISTNLIRCPAKKIFSANSSPSTRMRSSWQPSLLYPQRAREKQRAARRDPQKSLRRRPLKKRLPDRMRRK